MFLSWGLVFGGWWVVGGRWAVGGGRWAVGVGRWDVGNTCVTACHVRIHESHPTCGWLNQCSTWSPAVGNRFVLYSVPHAPRVCCVFFICTRAGCLSLACRNNIRLFYVFGYICKGGLVRTWLSADSAPEAGNTLICSLVSVTEGSWLLIPCKTVFVQWFSCSHHI